MTEKRPSEAWIVRFTYPKKAWALPLFCHLWLFFLVVFQLYGRVPKEFADGYWWMIPSYLLMVCIWLWNWPFWGELPRRSITADHKGISVGKRFIEWQAIEKIDIGPPTIGRAAIRLRLKRKPRSFFSVRSGPKNPLFAAHPTLYRQIIPAILKERPEWAVSLKVQRLLKQPDRAGAPRLWLLVPALTIISILLAAALFSKYQNLSGYTTIGSLMNIIVIIAGAYAMPVIRNTGESYVKNVLMSGFLLGSAIIAFSFGIGDLAGMELIIRAGLLMSITALLVVFVVKELSAKIQYGLLCMLLIPAGLYWYQIANMLPTTQIRVKRAENDYSSYLWAQTGEYLTDGDGCHLLNAPTGQITTMPTRRDRSNVIWLDERYLIQSANDVNDAMQLWVRDLQRGCEYKAPTGLGPSPGCVQPVSPDGTMLAWVDQRQDPNEQEIRLMDLDTRQLWPTTYTLPTARDWHHNGVIWADQNSLVVYGRPPVKRKPAGGYNLHLLNINRSTNERLAYESPIKCTGWYPSPNWRYVLGIVKDGEQIQVHLVDMVAARHVTLPGNLSGDKFPLPMTECAYRIDLHKGRHFLLCLDYAMGIERPVAPAPRGAALYAVDRYGRFALLGPPLDETFAFARYELLNLSTGRRQRIRVPNSCAGLSSIRVIINNPAASPFSPDGRTLVLESFTFVGTQVCLCELPSQVKESGPKAQKGLDSE